MTKLVRTKEGTSPWVTEVEAGGGGGATGPTGPTGPAGPAGAGGGALFYPRYVTDLYYSSPLLDPNWPGAYPLGTSRKALAVPYPVGSDQTFKQIAVHVTTQGATGGVVRLGVASDDGAEGPGTLVLDAGTVATDDGADSGSSVHGITIDLDLVAGFYWLIVQGEPFGTDAGVLAAATFVNMFGMALDEMGETANWLRTTAFATSPFPASFDSDGGGWVPMSDGVGPIIMLRAA